MAKKPRTTRHISCGSETTERLNILMTQLTFSNEDTVSALHDYYVKGHIKRACCDLNDLSSESNFERDIDRVNEVAAFVVAIEEHDWVRFKSENIQKTEGTVTSQIKNSKLPLLGQTWVISGTMTKMSRLTAKKRLEALGAMVVGSVDSKTYCLVVGEKAGAKLLKATELRIKVMQETEFTKFIKKMEK